METDVTTDKVELVEVEELLFASEGVDVWRATQETLENQALDELNQFAKETSSKLEDGEIESDGGVEKTNEILNLEKYIEKQQELQKLQAIKNLTKKQKAEELNTEKVEHKVDRKRKHKETCEDSDDDYIPSDEDSDYECDSTSTISQKKRKINVTVRGLDKCIDDGLLEDYKSRLRDYYTNLEKSEGSHVNSESTELVDDIKLGGKLKVPSKYWQKLYKYQRKGLKWLWSLHQQSTGGLLGDEMGLGKTVQIIAFLYALDYSRIHSPFGNFIGLGPTIVVCPATVIYQWVRHFHEWAPEFRIAVLHQSGRYSGNKATLIREINEKNGILVTTYQGILKYKGNLLDHQWYYFILDEGHKIRNASAKITRAVKQIRTPHRIILTGSPMQNNLQELWSLFDFTNPGTLGELSTFMEHFNNPIVQGGFANSTPMQEATALSVATALKNMISPFLLRRTKAEVQDHIELPNKSEQVLFCSLSEFQRRLYKDYLMSEHVNNILGRGVKKYSSDNYFKASMLMAITRLRKICNHPDIFLYDEDEVPDESTSSDPENQFGFYKKSGKMIVVSALLKIWKKQKHRVLLFSQGRAMISIFEQFLKDENYNYLKMDGSTSVKSRQSLIDKFNNDDSFDVFLLTTKVGGLGVNLTGADRVIIYDPDWNPATDTQARERAWRIGQNKQVTIYRLLTAGTIEEKIYQRQIWKQLLSNKILLDPKTHRAFKSSDLFDLFSLVEPTDRTNPETANIFHESRVKIQEKVMEKKKKKKLTPPAEETVVFSQDKIEQMRLLAQQLAKNIAPKVAETKEPKVPFQRTLEEEIEEKKQKKEELKKLPPNELLQLNRKKAKHKEEDSSNQVDDNKTSCSFSDALQKSETNAKLYRKLVEGKLNNVVAKYKQEKEEKKSKKVDKSGKIDGEKVEGLIKCEQKKLSKGNNKTCDDFILSKLFSSKGVSGALEHDSIITGSVRENNLRISTEASDRANKSIEAIKKSKLQRWRW